MKTTIETINGKLCTVIRKPFDAEWVRGQLADGFIVHVEGYWGKTYVTGDSGHKLHLRGLPHDLPITEIDYTLAILPALPKHPKSKDELLIFRYYSEGLEPVLTDKGENYSYLWVRPNKAEITHAIHAETGERVEIAIEEAK